MTEKNPQFNPYTVEIKTTLLFGLFFLGITGAILFLSYADTAGTATTQTASVGDAERGIPSSEESTALPQKASFPDVALSAEAAIVYDARDGRTLFEKNAHQQLPLASITKLMTAHVATKAVPDENSEIAIPAGAFNVEGWSSLEWGARWRFTSLRELSLHSSVNHAAEALSLSLAYRFQKDDRYKNAFIAEMNREANRLGMSQSFFLNATGLDESRTVSGGNGSARDVATLMTHILRTTPEMLSHTRDLETRIDAPNETIVIENTNAFVGNIPGLLASKTGFTDLAGGNLVVAFDLSFGHPIVVVVLGATRESRFTDATELSKATREYFMSQR